MHNGEFEYTYQNATLPPPYAQQLYIKAVKTNDNVQIKFEQNYLYRDEISVEEVIQEGFPIEDTYKWKGTLPLAWFDASLALFEKTTLIKDDEKILKKEPKIWIRYRDEHDKLVEGMPGDLRSWEYFLQEFIQAIYEKGKMEKPLRIRMILDIKQTTRSVCLTPSFVSRTLQVEISEAGKKYKKSVDWKLFRITAKHVYALDYLSEKSVKNKPENQGLFIDPGDDLWYEAGTAAKEPNKGAKNIDKIRDLINSF
jgi:hypothetical protein